jgi:hypothetical protein
MLAMCNLLNLGNIKVCPSMLCKFHVQIWGLFANDV